ncbi:hypothetical protein HDK64DRAFT_258377 [Phyllosticta capitalensis]
MPGTPVPAGANTGRTDEEWASFPWHAFRGYKKSTRELRSESWVHGYSLDCIEDGATWWVCRYCIEERRQQPKMSRASSFDTLRTHLFHEHDVELETGTNAPVEFILPAKAHLSLSYTTRTRPCKSVIEECPAGASLDIPQAMDGDYRLAGWAVGPDGEQNYGIADHGRVQEPDWTFRTVQLPNDIGACVFALVGAYDSQQLMLHAQKRVASWFRFYFPDLKDWDRAQGLGKCLHMDQDRWTDVTVNVECPRHKIWEGKQLAIEALILLGSGLLRKVDWKRAMICKMRPMRTCGNQWCINPSCLVLELPSNKMARDQCQESGTPICHCSEHPEAKCQPHRLQEDLEAVKTNTIDHLKGLGHVLNENGQIRCADIYGLPRVLIRKEAPITGPTGSRKGKQARKQDTPTDEDEEYEDGDEDA